MKKAEVEGKIKDRFLSFLETLKQEAAKTDSKPILIIREVQKLVDEDSVLRDTKTAFNSLFTCFEQYKQGTKNVSIIIESSKYLWSDLRRYVKSSPQSFKEYQVQQWSKEEGYNELVIIHEIFTAEEYEKVWNAVGGHGGEIFDLHCDL
jgi:hypothetical protein